MTHNMPERSLFSGMSRNAIMSQVVGVLIILAIAAFTGPRLVEVLNKHYISSGWVQVPARLVELSVSAQVSGRGGKEGRTTVYRLTGHYVYEYGGKRFSGSQISYYPEHDNIDSWHEETQKRLKRADELGVLTAWVNPLLPHQSYLLREFRWGYFLFGVLFFSLFFVWGLALIVVPRLQMPRGVDRHGQVYPQRDRDLFMLVVASLGSICISIPFMSMMVE
ncbi:MAG: DUF3592 domain-containing protein, partial [Thalassolituus sp.]